MKEKWWLNMGLVSELKQDPSYIIRKICWNAC